MLQQSNNGYFFYIANVQLARHRTTGNWGHSFAWSRNGAEYAGTMTRIGTGLRKLRVKSCTIDGEAIAFRPDGHSDFFALRGKDGQAIAVLVAFDLLELNGSDLRKLP